MPETPNHNYNLPSAGTQNWHQPVNENFRQYDTDIEIRDQAHNLSEYEPKDGAKFLATDTGTVFVGDGDQWAQLPTPTRAGSLAQNIPEPTVHGYAELKDSGGNQITGSTDFDGRTGLIKVLQFDHDISIPVDTQKGELQGLRQHRPFTFVKPTGQSTPLLMNALTNGETLQEAVFYWYRQDSGNTNQFFTTTLTNAKLAGVEMFGSVPQESVSLLYDEITWTIIDGNISSSDSWSAER